jgi:phosphoglycerate dehydrogenase-like enzyme
MKIVVLGDKATYQTSIPDNPYLSSPDCHFLGRTATNDEVVAACPDAEVLMFDAIAVVDADLIGRLPKLRMMCSEGVGYNGVDLDAATRAGIYVCNNHGGNAGAVAEQTILLMLSVLRKLPQWDAQVRAGHQMDVKKKCLATGCITDLADCTVGLIGMGDIAQAVAERLQPFGPRVVYHTRHRRPPELEEKLGIEWADSVDDVLAQADIVSLHSAATPQTAGMVDRAFLAKMRPGAYLINTSRGELVDSSALADALEAGTIAGAGLDTVAPEPVMPDNPLLNLSEAAAERVVFSPHIGGITAGSMRRMQIHMWENVARLERGEKPDGIVNGL